MRLGKPGDWPRGVYCTYDPVRVFCSDEPGVTSGAALLVLKHKLEHELQRQGIDNMPGLCRLG
jgi:hypothetical protein